MSGRKDVQQRSVKGIQQRGEPPARQISSGNGANRTEMIGKAPVWGLLLRFSGPAITSMVVAASYNLVDAIFVGRLGPEALGALAVSFPLMMIFMAVSMGAAMGATSFISRCFGAGKHGEVDKAAGAAIGLAVVIGLLMAAVCLPNMEKLLRFFGATESVLPMATEYMSILAAFAVVMSTGLAMGNIVRAEGFPMLSGVAMITSAVGNIILDPVLIFGLGPAPELGIAGAAIATVLGRGIGVVIMLVHFISGRTQYRFYPSYFLPRPGMVANFYRVGFASTIRLGSESLVLAFANTIAVSFGVIPLAVLGVVFRLARFIFMPTMGLGQGMLPLVGYNFGARQQERVGELVIKTGMLSLGWGLLCWSMLMLFPARIMSVFNSDPQFLAIGVPAMRIFTMLLFIAQLQRIASFFFQGIGKGKASIVLEFARPVIFLMPALLVLPRLFGINGFWMAFPVADGLSILWAIAWTVSEFRHQDIPIRLRY
jgi:putative MATE family efflux protein